jgi:acyl carrier protein
VEEMTARICEFIREEVLLDEHQVLDARTPLLGGILDSLGILNLVAFLEEEYSILLDEADLVAGHFRTPADIAEFMQSKLSSKSDQPA